MAEFSLFYDSVDSDRNYSSEDFGKYFSSFLTNGIKNGGNNLKVEATTQIMKVTVLGGIGFINGHFYILTENMDLSVDMDTQPRIDRVVLRHDATIGERRAFVTIKKGTASSNPIPPELIRNANVHELSLAQIKITPTSTQIPQANIIDERFNQDLCGIINSLITLDTADFEHQAEQLLESIRNMAGSDILELLATVAGSLPNLDVGKLNGQLASYYLDYNNLNNKPSETISEIKGNGTVILPDANKSVNITPANIGAATSVQGGKADTAVQGIKCNGKTIPLDGSKNANITLADLGITYGTSAPNSSTPGKIYIQY